MRRVAVLVLALAAVAGIGGWWSFGRDNGVDLSAFFTLPTTTTCESSTLTITASNGHFAAFTDGRELAETGDKFLVADVVVRNKGTASAGVAEDSFYLTERPGERRRPAALKAGARPLLASLEPGGTASGTLAFSVPASVGAAKLAFDDGCMHQEWLVP